MYLLLAVRWTNLCDAQELLKQFCEQKRALGKPNFEQVGHFMEACFPHLRHAFASLIVFCYLNSFSDKEKKLV